MQAILLQAVDWAERQAARSASQGRSLTDEEAAWARQVGVAHPDRVRLLVVDTLPLPAEEPLRSYAIQSGLLGPSTNGLTLGYSILIRQGHFSKRVLSHELRHVHQFEELGSMQTFLPTYLRQFAAYGYWNAPFEIDARQHELGMRKATEATPD